MTDQTGRRVQYQYDASGDLVAVIDPAGTLTQLVYGQGGAPAHYLTGHHRRPGRAGPVGRV